jgi:hypothetical protein
MKHPHLACLVIAAFLAGGGCRSAKVSQATGSEFVWDAGKTRAVTYVTPEEYERMTDEERARLNASMGAKVEWSTGKQKSEPVKTSDLDEAMKSR